jgi:hypothetical protein
MRTGMTTGSFSGDTPEPERKETKAKRVHKEK